MYVSRGLSKTEQKYSQVEREALAVVWSGEKLHFYLNAKEFDIITDNKAVELIFESKLYDVIQSEELNVGDVPEIDVSSELKSENRAVISEELEDQVDLNFETWEEYSNEEEVSVKEVIRPKRNTRPFDRYGYPVIYFVKSNNQQ
ncbi:unnamed protein product [Brachionus calyciflorus]|uniref:Reverse transcriptase RNase H-like domain-containing protein n=1 Tax=Brachionus calyciflorus TaxID=104777 RepID=A0A813T4X6_9BILA|nr:unnamed protein product [Brachionus calyciflorus]